jgi:hypothetical protein
MAYEDHWLPGFNFNVEEWFEGDQYETLAICRALDLAHAAFAFAIAEKPFGWFMIRSRTRVVASRVALSVPVSATETIRWR